MPITQSVKKALRQSRKKAIANYVIKKDLKQTVKDFKKSVGGGDLDRARQALPIVYKKLDKMAKRGQIKKNTASRTKSRLSRRLNRQSQKTT